MLTISKIYFLCYIKNFIEHIFLYIKKFIEVRGNMHYEFKKNKFTHKIIVLNIYINLATLSIVI